MNKIKTLVRAPALTRSGYGTHSRQVIFGLLNDPTYDVYLEAVPWGNTPFLSDKSNETQTLKQLSMRYEQAKAQGQDKDWGMFITITIPQEFERRGKLNVGITAAAETDCCSPDWVKKCNEMDLIITPSMHAMKNLTETLLNWVNNQTNESGTLKVQKPTVVAPEGFDPRYFKPKEKLTTRIGDLKFPSSFNFLVVGQWGPGAYGEDRKNISNTILYFLRAFQNRKDVGLVLKVNMARNSALDKEFVEQRIKGIKQHFKPEECPPIHLIHEHLTDEEMGDLYNHPQIKSFLTLTHGEGFGLPILEAAACGLPIIATAWSGHLDFLCDKGEKLFSAVRSSLEKIPAGSVWEPILVKESSWAVCDEEDSIHRMRKMVDSYRKPKEWANKLAEHVGKNFTLALSQKRILKLLQEFIKHSKGAQITNAEGFSDVIEDQNAYNILFTMPMSAGDVFLSTYIIDSIVSSVKKAQDADVHLYFATQSQYRSILDGNPNVYKVINWQESMMDVSGLEQAFDLVLTPNVATQFLFSNWVRGGAGRNLLEEYANHCQVEIGKPFIGEDESAFSDVIMSSNGDVDLRRTPYITFHPGSGEGQWSARKYQDWAEALHNFKKYFPDVKIVQVGVQEDMSYSQVDFDMRGKTTVQQMASIIKFADMHVGIDSFPTHVAASYKTPLVALYGSSYAQSSGPWYQNPDKENFLLLESQNKMGCQRACYKYTCKVNPAMSCINEIDSYQVVSAMTSVLSEGKNSIPPLEQPKLKAS